MPAALLQALQAPSTQTMAAKEFLPDAERSKLDTEPLAGERVQALVVEFLGMPAQLEAESVKMLTAP